MNTNNDILYRSFPIAEKLGELKPNITLIPDHLQKAAKKELNGQESVKAKPGGLLANFAAKIRANKEVK